MYNTKVVCTYNYYDATLPVIKPLATREDVEDLDEVSNDLYKAEFLLLFGLEIYDNDTIKTTMLEVLNKVKSNEAFFNCTKKAAGKMNSTDPEMGFMVLYSYHLFYITHPCVSEFLETGTISEERLGWLQKALA